jgi:putative heme-binding domain-containing protein
VLEQYQSTLNMNGNPVHGQAVFERVCAQCHQMKSEIGTAFGPDLSAIRNRSTAAIMTDILLPNQSIADGYEFWEVTLTDDSKEYGIIVAETVTSITLTHAGGDEKVIQRASIQSMEASEVSAMPPGLENQLNPQEMADLIAYLKQTKVYP